MSVCVCVCVVHKKFDASHFVFLLWPNAVSIDLFDVIRPAVCDPEVSFKWLNNFPIKCSKNMC